MNNFLDTVGFMCQFHGLLAKLIDFFITYKYTVFLLDGCFASSLLAHGNAIFMPRK